MQIDAIRCLNCGTILFSRTRHDFRSCGCSAGTFIDGGQDYCRVGGDFSKIRGLTLEVEVTQEELYRDWNTNTDKFGKYELPPKILSIKEKECK